MRADTREPTGGSGSKHGRQRLAQDRAGRRDVRSAPHLIWLVAEGRSLAGSPAELVASGAIARACDTDEVVFSSERQRFELVPDTGAD